MIVADPRPDARPEWDDLTPVEQDEHRSTCTDLCAQCENDRMFGECAHCGAFGEADSAGLSLCCGAVVGGAR